MLHTTNERDRIVLVISGSLVQSYKAISSSKQEGGCFYQASGKSILNFVSHLLPDASATQVLSVLELFTSFPKLPTVASPWGWSVVHFFSN